MTTASSPASALSRRIAIAAMLTVALATAGCAGPAPRGDASAAKPGERRPARDAAATRVEPRAGGYYLDDGPEDQPPPGLESVPDAQPRAEPLHPRANRTYTVFGRAYTPMTLASVHRERGIASWYGRKFHGRRTASGEVYDMYAMTAAHPTLPIPSYVRVTNVRNGRSVVVRVNDRGPFLSNRVIDLSYTAALKLDYLRVGVAEVDVELVRTGDMRREAAPEAAAGPGTSPESSQESSPRPVAVAPPADGGSEAPRLTIETIIAAADADGPANDASGPLGDAQGPRAGSTFLQLGAFSTRARADAARVGFVREFGWLDVPIGIVADGRLFKVQAGPWPNRDQALQAAARIADVRTERPIAVFR